MRIAYGFVGVLLGNCVLAWWVMQMQMGGRFGCNRDKDTGMSITAIRDRKLAVIVPLHRGDADLALESLSLWPSRCSALTMNSADLVLYYAEDATREPFIRSFIDSGSPACFRSRKVVSGNLTSEENVYPRGSNVQFYKLFLDHGVREHFLEYDALAIIEWDVIVARHTSFERLYLSAFASSEPFWVKGSILGGSEFHSTAALPELWHILAHINGNAIYNNTDAAFVEYVNFTFNQWQHTYSYDVALWATISNFPYSWPLRQRYASKFVATNLISNVGFNDVDDGAISRAVEAGTLFIHGSTRSSGGLSHGRRRPQERAIMDRDGCTEACGGPGVSESAVESWKSTVCDSTCIAREGAKGPRFQGKNCGAGDPQKYGEACRLCYKSQIEALAAEQAIRSADVHASEEDEHVVMCESRSPPEALECGRDCAGDPDTICDPRCGGGRYSDWNCDWRGLGQKCRFCFHDAAAAKLADAVASRDGGRVIMCDTHEPPPLDDGRLEIEPRRLLRRADRRVGDEDYTERRLFSRADLAEELISNAPASSKTFVPGVTYGQLCAFMAGYFDTLAEAVQSVRSINTFMPGMKVAIATSPADFHAFRRTFEHMDAVSLSNVSHVGYAALIADEACGSETRLIYYMGQGELLSRPFTPRDTHSSRGELLVLHSDAANAGEYHALRSLASAAFLGFHPPAFTYGADLMLPAEANAMLRASLPALATACESSNRSKAAASCLDVNLSELDAFVRSKGTGIHSTIDFREMLGAFMYSLNPAGVRFVDHVRWNELHMFDEVPMSSIPLVKPLFGCKFPIHWVRKGYDVAAEMSTWVDAFQRGARCDRGFAAVDAGYLRTKAHWEFGPRDSVQRMPSLKDYRVSITYRVRADEVNVFSVSLSTVIIHIPEALEVVVVVDDDDGGLFQRVVARQQGSAPFPIRVVSEMSSHIGVVEMRKSYAEMRADIHTQGDFILHLDPGAVVMKDIHYDSIFHFGKPVLPFGRYRSETAEGLERLLCWQEGTSFAVGEKVVHDFDVFSTHVYPREMYRALRDFVRTYHGTSLENFLSGRKGMCELGSAIPTVHTNSSRQFLSHFNFMGAFLWYHMHDAVHWMATDPYDVRPDEWRPNPEKYSWTCRASAIHYPADRARQDQFRAEYRRVRDANECRELTHKWRASATGPTGAAL